MKLHYNLLDLQKLSGTPTEPGPSPFEWNPFFSEMRGTNSTYFLVFIQKENEVAAVSRGP